MRDTWASVDTAAVSMNGFSAFRLAGGWRRRTNNVLSLIACVATIGFVFSQHPLNLYLNDGPTLVRKSVTRELRFQAQPLAQVGEHRGIGKGFQRRAQYLDILSPAELIGQLRECLGGFAFVGFTGLDSYAR